MPTIADTGSLVTGGVNTHAEVHVARDGRPDRPGTGDQGVPGYRRGYAAALAWMRSHGQLVKVGVEGTGSYGAGLGGTVAPIAPKACAPKTRTGQERARGDRRLGTGRVGTFCARDSHDLRLVDLSTASDNVRPGRQPGASPVIGQWHPRSALSCLGWRWLSGRRPG